MVEARQDMTDASEKLRLAVSSFQAVGENVTALAADMGTWSLLEATASVSKNAGVVKAQASKVVQAAEVAEAAATRATAAVTAAYKARAAAAMAKKVAAQAAAAASKAAQAAEVAEATAAALEAGNMCGIFVVFLLSVLSSDTH